MECRPAESDGEVSLADAARPVLRAEVIARADLGRRGRCGGQARCEVSGSVLESYGERADRHGRPRARVFVVASPRRHSSRHPEDDASCYIDETPAVR